MNKTHKNIAALLMMTLSAMPLMAQEKFPDGTEIPQWFKDTKIADVKTLGKSYVITEQGVKKDSMLVQTAQIQAVIDKAAADGGGVVVIPEGVYQSGSLFFRAKTHLHLEKGAVLKGSDDISNFEIKMTRMEGQTLKYFTALVNADGVDGFTISGEGTINGNGLRYWKSFWLRRKVNPQCTNMDEMRPRLVYISNCKDVQLSGVKLIDSPFWTTHLYRCENVKLLGLHISSPVRPVKAPSTDAVDIDACRNILIKNCYMAVNDDAVALKGGKGPWADKDETNGANSNIIIEDCRYGFCHSALTFGSESLQDRNVVLRRCELDRANRLLWFKMRPDTPQNYEYVLVEDIKGSANYFLVTKPWRQFFDLKGREDIPMSYSDNVTMRNIKMECKKFFDVQGSEQYRLTNFTFENIELKAENDTIDKSIITPFILKNVVVNGKKLD